MIEFFFKKIESKINELEKQLTQTVRIKQMVEKILESQNETDKIDLTEVTNKKY